LGTSETGHRTCNCKEKNEDNKKVFAGRVHDALRMDWRSHLDASASCL
jgi:hypothetical protein